jgi:carboxyl-terminal processing protease
MNRSRALFLVLSLAVLAPLVTGVLWSAADRRADDGEDSLYKYLAIFSEVLGLVRNNYVDPAELDQLLAGAMDGSTDALDSFSIFLPKGSADVYRRALEIGNAHSGVVALKDHGIAFVVAVEEGSPGDAAGLESGDILASIDGRETREMPAWELEALLAGRPGSQLAIEVIRRGDAQSIELELGPFAPAAPRVEEIQGESVLRVPRFDAATPEAVATILRGLTQRGVERLLVDLREVAGGSPAAAYETAGLFAQGELGRLEKRGTEVTAFRGEKEPVWKGRLAVLVDGGTLGAAEILAAVLQEKADADLVGVKTFGWAGERSLVDLPGGGRLRLTTAFYTGPGGGTLSKGLAPDLLVDELTRSFAERDLSLRDLILDRGLRHLRGDAAAEKRAA